MRIGEIKEIDLEKHSEGTYEDAAKLAELTPEGAAAYLRDKTPEERNKLLDKLAELGENIDEILDEN